MKTIERTTRKGTARKIMAMALAFAMIMQFSCLTAVSAWADTEVPAEPIEIEEEISAEIQEEVIEEEILQETEQEIVQEELQQEEAVQEEVEEVKVETEAEEEEIKAEAETEIKEEVKTETKEVVETEIKEEKKEVTADLTNPPMATNQKMFTGIFLRDSNAGNINGGYYYGIAYTDSLEAIDSRYIPFSTKLTPDQYRAAHYDFTNLELTFGGKTYVYRPNGPQKGDGKDLCYYTTKFMKIDKLEKITYTDGYLTEGWPTHWELVTDLKKDATTGLYKEGYYHRDYEVFLHVGDEPEAEDVTPMAANQKMLTGIRLGDGKAGNGDGKYYGIDFTETFEAIDSRHIPFETKLVPDQYRADDYDFTDLVLTFKGKTYAYRPNGPQNGDGKDFCYYTTKLMKIDKLAKSTYSGGYLTEGWPTHWGLITNLKKDAATGLYKDGYYHRDYQVTLHVGDAPDADEPVIEEPVIEEPAIEEPAVQEEIEEPAIETPAEEMIEEPAEAIEELAGEIEELAEKIEELTVETLAEEDIESLAAEKEDDDQETAPAVITRPAAPQMPETTAHSNTVSAETGISEITSHMAAPAAATAEITEDTAYETTVTEITEDKAPKASNTMAMDISEEATPKAAPSGAWAVLNILTAILSGVMSLGMLHLCFAGKDHRYEAVTDAAEGGEEDHEIRRKGLIRALSLIPAIASAVIFILTEDMNQSMVLADQWTAVMAALLAVTAIMAILSKKSENEAENN